MRRASANFNAAVKFQQFEAAAFRNRSPTEQHPRPNIFDARGALSAPMYGYAARLEFGGVAKLLVAKPIVRIGQSVKGSRIQFLHLHAAICFQTLQAVTSPNFRAWMQVEQRIDFGRISPGNYHHTSSATAHNFLQQQSDSGIWICLVAFALEWRQRSVIVEQ